MSWFVDGLRHTPELAIFLTLAPGFFRPGRGELVELQRQGSAAASGSLGGGKRPCER